MRRIPALILILALLSACVSTVPEPESVSSIQQRTLTVFAAASLSGAFDEIADVFEATHTDVDVMLSFAGSNTLRAQIEQGAPADVFASANVLEMDDLVAKGFVATGVPKTFLTNRLVVIMPATNPAGLSTLYDLARPGLKLVLATEDVPVGRYARLMMENVGSEFKSQVLENLASNESTVKQVLAKVQLGEADAGIVYISDAITAPELPVIEIPEEWNVLAEYPIATLIETSYPEMAVAFVSFVCSPEGQAIIQKWGFSPP